MSLTKIINNVILGSSLALGIACSDSKVNSNISGLDGVNNEMQNLSKDTNNNFNDLGVYREMQCFPDKDKDGYAIKGESIIVKGYNADCPEYYAELSLDGIHKIDCDDNDSSIHPFAKEICDNKDNDCDGETDEDTNLEQACGVNNISECKLGTEKKYCEKGNYTNWKDCTATFPTLETCDGKDNDCNGKTDEDLTQSCDSKCGSGLEYCIEGKFQNCDASQPKLEECNGLDDDCNGKIDEDIVKPCYSSCGEGKTVCTNGKFSECDAPQPTNEECDGKDNNCNGEIDENLEKIVSCGPNDNGKQKLVCENGQYIEKGICDGKDNCKNGTSEQQECGSNVGECKKGTQTRVCENGQWNPWDSCKGEVGAAEEKCNSLDDDCNGVTDENIIKQCYSGCGEGKIVCANGKFKACDAPKPSENGECCKPGTKKNQIYCFDQKNLKEEDICINFKWEHEEYKCPCVEYKWMCKNKIIGITCVNPSDGIFIEKEPTDADVGSSKKKNGIPQWCCKDSKGQEWGVESSPSPEFYLKKTCYCITKAVGINDNDRRKLVLAEANMCPKHEFSELETLISVLFENYDKENIEVWINWFRYGFPPSEKVMLGAQTSYEFFGDKKAIPLAGGEMQLCTSKQGCSENIYLESGMQNDYKIIILNGNVYAVNKIGEEITFPEANDIYIPCDRKTEVLTRFSNQKTLDLQVWVNWLSKGFPPGDKLIVEPSDEQILYINETMMGKQGADMMLCTSSYGCVKKVHVNCGDKLYLDLRWMFGNANDKK